MDRFGTQARKLVETAALGLLATAPLYLPPAQIATRLNAWLYDTWSELNPPAVVPGIAVAPAETPAALVAIVAAAKRRGVRLVVTTLPFEPTTSSPQQIVGPVEIGADGLRAEPPGRQQGGHLRFDADIDGVYRRDTALLHKGREVPSLAHYAATTLAATEPRPELKTRVLVRLPLASSIPIWSDTVAAAADAEPVPVIVVAGPAGPTRATPVGLATTTQLVAQTLSSHLGGHYLHEHPLASAGTWVAALLFCALYLSRTPRTRWHAAGSIAMMISIFLAASAAAFLLFRLWLPVIGPLGWSVLTTTLLTIRRADATRNPMFSVTARITRARHAADNGQLMEAWAFYRTLPTTPGSLPELYDLARALGARGADDEAAELFHRIAQVDSRFRDVARRLVKGSHASPTDHADPPPPAAIGRYQLLEEIGRGAMGHVYLGRDPIINRIVALKAIDLSVGYATTGIESTTESFLREATIAGGLSHPNIVTIFDVGEASGLAYIAMEYVRGHHLSEFATSERLLPVDTVLDLVSRAADALDYAHRQNVVHRDIKPANIMYDSISNNLKITDFGIAKLIDANRTRTGIILGTPAYMSPEQLEGRNVNGHTDLFALGVSLYQLLTGHLPFRGASMTNLMFVIANEPHESVTRLRSDLPKWLDGVLDKALAKNPADRFQNGADMAAALRHAA